ncbi:hypothetical protein ACCO45_004012 [Purpureocillium lilacinum]|uniref:Uncharacterized protein n=1 Tax=Purpureocillium lilacinum TaxID=33203 RepID=A0ACC4E420_PURLI
MSGGHKPIRLPPLKTLRVHAPKRQPENPCIAIMSSVLAPAVHGRSPPPPAPANTINYHLSRMQKYVTSPRKQK